MRIEVQDLIKMLRPFPQNLELGQIFDNPEAIMEMVQIAGRSILERNKIRETDDLSPEAITKLFQTYQIRYGESPVFKFENINGPVKKATLVFESRYAATGEASTKKQAQAKALENFLIG